MCPWVLAALALSGGGDSEVDEGGARGGRAKNSVGSPRFDFGPGRVATQKAALCLEVVSRKPFSGVSG